MSGIPNIGESTRLPYDADTYPDALIESVNPGNYRLNENHIHNCGGCLSLEGPVGYGASSTACHVIAESQKLVDQESLLSNRNVKASKSKKGKVNHIDFKDHKFINKSICPGKLAASHSRITHPRVNYRGAPINRFYNLIHDPQENIFFDWSINSTLEAKDNYDIDVPVPLKPDNYPSPLLGDGNKCVMMCNK